MNRFDLGRIFEKDIREIFAAHQVAKIIHSSGNIRASGNEVENCVRDKVAARLPRKCRKTQGHVIDWRGNASPQIDVIICDGINSSRLFEAADGTEYVPYESVYAIGEVKSTYYKSDDPIAKFSKTVNEFQSLSREATRRNPLLSFMVFVDSNDFGVEDAELLYGQSALETLPTMVCFLDRGVILHASFLRTENGAALLNTYHLAPAVDSKSNEENHWTLVWWEQQASNLMFIQVALNQHVDSCTLAVPDLFRYLVLEVGHWKGGVLFNVKA